MQNRFKRFLPGGGGSKGRSGGALILIIILLLAGWLQGFYRVNPQQQGVVLRFGEWVRTTSPGLHYHLHLD